MINETKRKQDEMESSRIQEMLEETQRFQKIEGTFDLYEMKQIEEWSGRYVNNIVFDSSVNLWNKKGVVGKGS